MQQRTISLAESDIERLLCTSRQHFLAQLDFSFLCQCQLILELLFRLLNLHARDESVAMHLAYGHLAFTLVRVVLRFLELVPDTTDPYELGAEIKTLKLLGLLNRNILHCSRV